MLRLIVGEEEFYDEEKNEFLMGGGTVLELEHSLVSLSKWEQIYKKPFLASDEKTSEEVFAYMQLMILNGVDPAVIYQLSESQLTEINEYLNSPESATTFGKSPGGNSQETITSELIYYWMVAFTIPFECQHWHLNRLFALIRVCSLKNQPAKKMSKGEIARRNRDLNAERRAKLGTRG